MSLDNLPVEWSKEKLGNLSNFIDYRGKTPTKTSAGIPLITAKNIRDGYINREPREYIAEDAYDDWMTRGIPLLGDLVITTEAPMGNVAILNIQEKFALAQRAICLNFKYNRDISKFLYYYLRSQSFKTDLQNKATGTTVQGIKAAELKKIFVPLAPLAEQQEIVRQLDLMLAQVEQIKARLDAIPAILKKFRQSVLADAVSGKLTEEWREQNNLPLANIEKLERVVDSSFYGPRFSKDDYTDDLQNGIPTIRTTDMSDGKIIVTPTTPRIIVPPEKIEQFKVKPSDLLITRTGSIGVMALVREEYLAIPSAYLIRFRFKQNLVSSDYIYYALTSPNGQNQMGLSTTAITQPNINANSIRALEIYLPSIEEQKEIVKRVDTLFGYAARIEETIQSAQKRVNLLTQSILAKAFSGELTAEWREQHQELIIGINSAESLLAAIQAEREASKPAKKTRKKKEV